MEHLLKKIEESYARRTGNPSLQKNCWERVTEILPPTLAAVSSDSPYSSGIIAEKSGDLGMALLWIVEASLIRGLLGELIKEEPSGSRLRGIAENIGPELIGALAHSEDKDAPLTLTEEGGRLLLSGRKKYITGGSTADFILITGREVGEEKISRMVLLPIGMLPPDALQELSLNTLGTISHASLNLERSGLPAHYAFSLEASTLRRALKKWSLIERSLILESFLGLMLYIMNRSSGLIVFEGNIRETVQRMRIDQTAVIRKQIASALEGTRVEENRIPVQELLDCVQSLKRALENDAGILSADLLARTRDLDLFSHIRL